ncbi:MAG: [FeFe] hydrogenase H-cluster radical SAM maturase HydE [Pseudomonadota bacterium]
MKKSLTMTDKPNPMPNLRSSIFVKTHEEILTRDDLIELLSIMKESELHRLYKTAYGVKRRYVGDKVYLRGIVEFSNKCKNDCFYCGIRKSNDKIKRYSMSEEEIVFAAKRCHEQQYGSIVLQSGERTDKEFISFVERLVLQIKMISSGKLGITLSLGEQSIETYRRWFEAGAHRYLLRIETSNKGLYQKLHAKEQTFETRFSSLLALKSIGYQVGCGVMIGLPGQSIEDLADDIIFFKHMDIDMIGMGPFIPHSDTPLACAKSDFEDQKISLFKLCLKMIATTRIYLKDVNIASTTALQVLDDFGREMGLKAGANIIMPNITDTRYRSYYKLYDNKPCVDEDSKTCGDCLIRRVEAIGERVGFNQWGDAPHFKISD